MSVPGPPLVMCSNPEPHVRHDWMSSNNGEWICEGIPEPDEVPPTGMLAVMAWLAEDHECNGVEIVMQCTGTEYDDDTDEVIGHGYAYEVKLCEAGMYGDDSHPDGAWTTYQHTGHGDTMDEAADNALKMKFDHDNSVKALLP